MGGRSIRGMPISASLQSVSWRETERPIEAVKQAAVGDRIPHQTEESI
jgi:hypothetical protein